jgi:hypothetical protein
MARYVFTGFCEATLNLLDRQKNLPGLLKPCFQEAGSNLNAKLRSRHFSKIYLDFRKVAVCCSPYVSCNRDTNYQMNPTQVVQVWLLRERRKADRHILQLESI